MLALLKWIYTFNKRLEQATKTNTSIQVDNKFDNEIYVPVNM